MFLCTMRNQHLAKNVTANEASNEGSLPLISRAHRLMFLHQSIGSPFINIIALMREPENGGVKKKGKEKTTSF